MEAQLKRYGTTSCIGGRPDRPARVLLGQAAARPSSVMNSRRLMSFFPSGGPRRPCWGIQRLRASAVQRVKIGSYGYTSETHCPSDLSCKCLYDVLNATGDGNRWLRCVVLAQWTPAVRATIAHCLASRIDCTWNNFLRGVVLVHHARGLECRLNSATAKLPEMFGDDLQSVYIGATLLAIICVAVIFVAFRSP